MEDNNISTSDLSPTGTPSQPKPKTKLYIAIGVAVFVVLAALIVWSLTSEHSQQEALPNSTPVDSSVNTQNTASSLPKWNFVDDKWVATGEVPACPDPLLKSPADVNLATGILYPGQFRGPYKAHGGMNFNGDNTRNDIEVVMAMDGVLIRAARYIQTGEVQYLLDFLNPCGVVLRYDHLLVLAPEFQQIMETLPQPVLNDSRTTDIKSEKLYKAGEVIALEIGFKNTDPKAAVFDFGVYDLRKPNEASRNATYVEEHKNSGAVDFYAICWLNYLSEADMKTLKALPVVSGESGRQSDYCLNL